MADLSDKELLFVAKFLELGNATEAYLQSGHPRATRKSAGNVGARWIKKPRIREAIATRQQRRLRLSEINADEAMKRLSAIATCDIRRLVDVNGQFLPVADWPDDIALVVKSFRTGRHGSEIVLDSRLEALKVIAAVGRRSREGKRPCEDLARILAGQTKVVDPPG